MSSDAETVRHFCDLLQGAGVISARKMFGEYAVYCDGKVVALVCDNQFYLRPTASAKASLPAGEMAPPYPGAKLHYLLDDVLEDRPLLLHLVRQVARETPLPAPRKRKSKPA